MRPQKEISEKFYELLARSAFDESATIMAMAMDPDTLDDDLDSTNHVRIYKTDKDVIEALRTSYKALSDRGLITKPVTLHRKITIAYWLLWLIERENDFVRNDRIFTDGGRAAYNALGAILNDYTSN